MVMFYYLSNGCIYPVMKIFPVMATINKKVNNYFDTGSKFNYRIYISLEQNQSKGSRETMKWSNIEAMKWKQIFELFNQIC